MVISKKYLDLIAEYLLTDKDKNDILLTIPENLRESFLYAVKLFEAEASRQSVQSLDKTITCFYEHLPTAYIEHFGVEDMYSYTEKFALKY